MTHYKRAMKEYLLSEIRRRQTDLDGLEQQFRSIEVRKAVLDAELNLLRQMLGRVNGEPEAAAVVTKEHSPQRRQPKASKSRLSPRWACVVAEAIKRYPAEIGTSEVPDIQKKAGQPEASGNQIRSHFWSGVESHLYERASYGTIRATQHAAEVLEIPLGSRPHLAALESPEGEPGSGQPRLGLNDLESGEAVDAARKAGGT
jgi:hypothetical protein